MLPQLEELAREIETLQRPELSDLILHVRDNTYDRNVLIAELKEQELGFFAAKLAQGYYEQYHEAFIDHLKTIGELPADPTPPSNQEVVQTQMTEQANAAGLVDPTSDTGPVEPVTKEPVDPETLPRCNKCELGDDSEATKHAFMTYDHPYENPDPGRQEQPKANG